MAMRFETLSFSNDRGDELAARLDLPIDRDPIACALFAHCFTCTKNLKAVGHVTRALTEQGFAVLRFDFTGLGESEGDFAESTFSSNVGDLVAAARFLADRYEAPRLLVGHSFGGTAVLQAAPQLADVKAVATIGAPHDPEHVEHVFEEAVDEIERRGEARVHIGGRPFTLKKAFLDDIRAQNVDDTLSTLDRALLVFHSPVDRIVDVDNARRIFEAARHPKSFVSLDQADHLLSDPADSAFVGSVLGAWARTYVDAPQEQVKHVEADDNVVVADIGTEHYRTEVLANGFSMVADEPESVGGTNTGPTPYEYLLASLGACTVMTLRMYADRKEWPLEGARARLEHQKIHAEDCAHCETEEGKIDRIQRVLSLEGPLDEAQRQRLLEIANRCPVHRTLTGEIDVRTRLDGA